MIAPKRLERREREKERDQKNHERIIGAIHSKLDSVREWENILARQRLLATALGMAAVRQRRGWSTFIYLLLSLSPSFHFFLFLLAFSLVTFACFFFSSILWFFSGCLCLKVWGVCVSARPGWTVWFSLFSWLLSRILYKWVRLSLSPSLWCVFVWYMRIVRNSTHSRL